MALRDQPYLPLYVQDFLTDEKLNECSASATGVYIKIMCVMHKSSEYGTILLKQKDKQKDKQIENFALKLLKHLPYSYNEILSGLNELIDEHVLFIDGDKICQKRMIKDNDISLKRAKAGKKGGNKTKFAVAKVEAKVEANSEYENKINNKDLINNLMSYFNFTEIKNQDKFSQAYYFINKLNSTGQLNYFKEQFDAYKIYKSKNKDEKIHIFKNFIGSAECEYVDGGWNDRNWAEAIKERKLTVKPARGFKNER